MHVIAYNQSARSDNGRLEIFEQFPASRPKISAKNYFNFISMPFTYSLMKQSRKSNQKK